MVSAAYLLDQAVKLRSLAEAEEHIGISCELMMLACACEALAETIELRSLRPGAPLPHHARTALV